MLLADGVKIAEALTDNAGYCELAVANPDPQTTYVLQFEKSDNPLTGVNVRDVIAIQRHILQDEPLASPYALLASDASRSGSVTTLDLAQIRALILGQQPAFNQSTWVFLPTDLTFPNPLSPWDPGTPINIEFVVDMQANQPAFNALGIKTGDVNQSAQVNPLMNDQDDPTISGVYALSYSAGGADLIKKGQTATFVFDAVTPAFYGQWAIDFSKWEILAVQAPQIPATSLLVETHTDADGMLRVLFTGAIEDRPLQFSVTARALATQSLKNLQLGDAIKAMVSNMANQHFEVKLQHN